jgi:hypothetical protein
MLVVYWDEVWAKAWGILMVRCSESTTVLALAVSSVCLRVMRMVLALAYP